MTQEQALELLAIGPDDEAAMETARMNYDAAKESFDSEFGAALDRMQVE